MPLPPQLMLRAPAVMALRIPRPVAPGATAHAAPPGPAASRCKMGALASGAATNSLACPMAAQQGLLRTQAV